MIGAKQHSITIKKVTLTDDGSGGKKESSTSSSTIWAEIIKQGGSRSNSSSGSSLNADYRLKVWYDPAIDFDKTDYYIEFNDGIRTRTLTPFRAELVDQRTREVIIYCNESK